MHMEENCATPFRFSRKYSKIDCLKKCFVQEFGSSLLKTGFENVILALNGAENLFFKVFMQEGSFLGTSFKGSTRKIICHKKNLFSHRSAKMLNKLQTKSSKRNLAVPFMQK